MTNPLLASILFQSSFSSATGALGSVPTFYAATVGSSYSKALAPSAGVMDGTIISINIVSLTAAQALTITPDGSDVIRHCGASLSSMVLDKDGAELMLRKRGAGWDVIFVRGRQNQEVWVVTPNGSGSTDTKIRRYTTATTNTGVAITRATSAANGDTFTINESGEYEISRSDFRSDAANTCGCSVNSNQLTTAVRSITAAHYLPMFLVVPAAGIGAQTTISVYFAPTNVVRAHDDSTVMNATTSSQWFRIRKLGE